MLLLFPVFATLTDSLPSSSFGEAAPLVSSMYTVVGKRRLMKNILVSKPGQARTTQLTGLSNMGFLKTSYYSHHCLPWDYLCASTPFYCPPVFGVQWHLPKSEQAACFLRCMITVESNISQPLEPIQEEKGNCYYDTRDLFTSALAW